MSVVLGDKGIFLFDMKLLPMFLCALVVWKLGWFPAAIRLFVISRFTVFARIPQGREFAALPKPLGRCTGYRRPPRVPELTRLEDFRMAMESGIEPPSQA